MESNQYFDNGKKVVEVVGGVMDFGSYFRLGITIYFCVFVLLSVLNIGHEILEQMGIVGKSVFSLSSVLWVNLYLMLYVVIALLLSYPIYKVVGVRVLKTKLKVVQR